MLQAHSLLWHYLWLVPQILQLSLGLFLFLRHKIFCKLFPVFIAYLLFGAFEELTLYAMDVVPTVSAETYWRTLWVGLIVVGLLKFAVIGELFRHLLRSWPALAMTGNRCLTGIGAVLILLAVVVAAYTTPENGHRLIGGALILTQTLYIIQCGLILFVFLFGAYFKIVWDRRAFGIALGFAILFCEHLANRAILVAVTLPDNGILLSFLNMATYHVCVLIWFYYLLVPQKVVTTSAVPLPEHSLDLWNRELERLLQQ